jgi:uncharacterized protein (TIGR00369 family)
MVTRVPLDPAVFGPESPCFGCSPTHPIGLHLRPELVTDERGERAVEVVFVPGERYQGPPGVMHGGLVMTLADELGAWTVIGLAERFGFTAAMSAKLHRPVRIGQQVVGRGTLLSTPGRVVKVGVTLSQADAATFSGELTFALLDEAGAERLLGGPLPASWRRFARSSAG